MEKTKNKNGGYLVTILIVLLLGAFLGFGFAMGSSHVLIMATEKKSTTKAKTTDNERDPNGGNVLEVTEQVKEELGRFIDVATTPSTTSTIDYFREGANGLTKDVKFKMNNISLYTDKLVIQNMMISPSENGHISGIQPDSGEIVDAIQVSVFNNHYKELFHEDPSYTLDDLKSTGCPGPVALNDELQVLYFYHRCGGTSATTYERNVTSYNTDGDYYYATQEITENNMATGEIKKNTIKWKFDKDLNFVSTTKES